MKRKTKTLSLFTALLISFSFTGCIKAEREVKDLTVIQGIGIDYDTEKDEYKLSVEVFDISQSTGMGESESGNLTKIVKCTGKSIASAMNQITLEIGKSLIYSQKRVIILGDKALDKGLLNVVDFFLRDYKTRSSVSIAVASGCTAAEIIEADEGDVSFPAREIQTLLDSGRLNGYTTDVDVASLTKMAEDNSASAYLPLLSINEEDRSKYTKLSGFAVIKGDRYKGDLTLEEGRGMLFVNDEIKGGSFDITEESVGLITLKITQNKTHIDTSLGSDKNTPRITVDINCVGDITEVQGDGRDGLNEESAKKVQKCAEEYIEKITNDALKKCLDEYEADVFGFTRRIWILYPSYYRENEQSLKQGLLSDTADVNVKFELRRLGQGNR